MFILTISGKEREGAYSVMDEDGDQILYLFEEEDDATRFAMQLEEDDYPEMNVMEVEDAVMIKTCEKAAKIGITKKINKPFIVIS